MSRGFRRDKLTKLVMDTYRELYWNCTTPVSFDELIESAEIDSDGRKIIPFDKYFIHESLAKEIINSNMKKMKMNKYEKECFQFEIALGCSPTYIMEEKKLNNHEQNKELV